MDQCTQRTSSVKRCKVWENGKDNLHVSGAEWGLFSFTWERGSLPVETRWFGLYSRIFPGGRHAKRGMVQFDRMKYRCVALGLSLQMKTTTKRPLLYKTTRQDCQKKKTSLNWNTKRKSGTCNKSHPAVGFMGWAWVTTTGNRATLVETEWPVLKGAYVSRKNEAEPLLVRTNTAPILRTGCGRDKEPHLFSMVLGTDTSRWWGYLGSLDGSLGWSTPKFWERMPRLEAEGRAGIQPEDRTGSARQLWLLNPPRDLNSKQPKKETKKTALPTWNWTRQSW